MIQIYKIYKKLSRNKYWIEFFSCLIETILLQVELFRIDDIFVLVYFSNTKDDQDDQKKNTVKDLGLSFD